MIKHKSPYKIFTSKSNVLKYLSPKLTHSIIEPILDFTVDDWNVQQSLILDNIMKKFKSTLVIIRSSASGEDSILLSEAGNYDSVQNIKANSKNELLSAINKVIISYKNKNNTNTSNQILVQKQSTSIIYSGVIFTRSSNNGSPYYVINYDEGKSTDSVTKGESSHTIKIFRDVSIVDIPKTWKQLIKSVQEIESIIDFNFLDIEFGINKKNKVIIFQVRPLIVKSTQQSLNMKTINNKITQNKKKFLKFNTHSSLFGKFTIFSDMCDWNPAEIIGNKPNLLDYSLYDYLIMRKNWSLGRELLGYSQVKTPSLMVSFSHKPYVDVRASFNSLLPDNLSNKLKKKLVNFYLNKLTENPFLHDKVEFEILFTCDEPMLDKKLKELKKNAFSQKEISIIKKSLKDFTSALVTNFSSVNTKSILSVDQLLQNRNDVIHKLDLSKRTSQDLFFALQKLLTNCIHFGIIPFSTMARLAFVSSIILKGLVSKNVLDPKHLELFMNSFETPLSSIQHDANQFIMKKISKPTFLAKYGHLRPGTYDIRASRYDDTDSNNDFFNNIKYLERNKSNSSYDEQFFIKLFAKHLPYDPEIFFNFVKQSITQREQIKFEFTKNLSLAIEIIAELGMLYGFSREDMSYLSINLILKSKSLKKHEIKKLWQKKIIQEKSSYSLDNFIMLPPLIRSKNDFEIQSHFSSKPNFITLSQITAKTSLLSNSNNNSVDLLDKIILIENADPGYDWIFTKNIGGLITKYGGVASHMAIRCSELGLPAAIGCGDTLFERLVCADTVLLDCKHHQIIILQQRTSNENFIEEKKLLKSLGYIR